MIKMKTNKFFEVYKQLIFQQTADITNQIIPLIKQNLNNNDIIKEIRKKDKKIVQYIVRYKKLKKEKLLSSLSQYITHNCNCKDDILNILKSSNDKTQNNQNNQNNEEKPEISPKYINKILNALNQNQNCLKYADEAFGEDYITNIMKKYEDNKEEACKQFKEILLEKDAQHQKSVKIFLKKFNKQTEGTFSKICKTIFSIF